MVLAEVSGISAVDTSSFGQGSSVSPGAGSLVPRANDFLVGLVTTDATLQTHPQPNW